jgi:hypothetical protein
MTRASSNSHARVNARQNALCNGFDEATIGGEG